MFNPVTCWQYDSEYRTFLLHIKSRFLSQERLHFRFYKDCYEKQKSLLVAKFTLGKRSLHKSQGTHPQTLSPFSVLMCAWRTPEIIFVHTVKCRILVETTCISDLCCFISPYDSAMSSQESF